MASEPDGAGTAGEGELADAPGKTEAMGTPKWIVGRRGRAGMVSSETGGGGVVGLTTAELVVGGGWDDIAMHRVGDSAAVMSVLTRRSGRG